MEQLRRNLESFYRVIQQALIRHGYVDQERDKLSFCFSKKFRYGRFTFSFRLEPVTSSVEVEPVRVYFDAVEAITQTRQINGGLSVMSYLKNSYLYTSV